MDNSKELISKWGTTKPVSVYDNSCKVELEIRSHGNFTYKITNEELFKNSFNGNESELINYVSTSFEKYLSNLKDLSYNDNLYLDVMKNFTIYIQNDANGKGFNIIGVSCTGFFLTDDSKTLRDSKEKNGECVTASETQSNNSNEQIVVQNNKVSSNNSEVNVIPWIVILLGVIVIITLIIIIIKSRKQKNNI